MPQTQEILALEREQVAGFIQSHVATKTLSPLIKDLNAKLMEGDPAAARALAHLGFPDVS